MRLRSINPITTTGPGKNLKLDALRQFVNAFKILSRIVNAEEGGEL